VALNTSCGAAVRAEIIERWPCANHTTRNLVLSLGYAQPRESTLSSLALAQQWQGHPLNGVRGAVHKKASQSKEALSTISETVRAPSGQGLQHAGYLQFAARSLQQPIGLETVWRSSLFAVRKC
jgi:hypothetical protein